MRLRASLWALGSIFIAVGSASGVGCGDSGTGAGGSASNGGAGGTSSTTTTTSTVVGGGGTTSVGGGGSTSATGGGGAGGGTGGGSNEKCPGEAHSLAVGSTFSVSGSTVGKADDFTITSAQCSGDVDASGADVVYAVTFQDEGTITATLTGANGLDAILYAESECGNRSSAKFCANRSKTAAETDGIAVLKGDTFYFVVDGNAGSSGDFKLDVKLAAPSCGDGFVNTGEECDDGNSTDGDGCTHCKKDTPDQSDICDGDIVPIVLNDVIDIQGDNNPDGIGSASTINYKNDYQTCDTLGPGNEPVEVNPNHGGNDRIFQFVAASAGKMKIELRNIGSNGGMDGALTAYRQFCAPSPMSGNAVVTGIGYVDPPILPNYLGCSDRADGMAPYVAGDTTTYEELQPITVAAGDQIFVVVDGYHTASAGQFWLHVGLTP